MADILFAWPAAAAFGRRVPKEKLYENAAVGASLREQFVSDVASIEWAFKLAESTVNLPGSEDVPEVQVFRITAKDEVITDEVLAAIDRAVTFPLIFEITRRDGMTRMAGSVQKTGAYHSTGWMPGGASPFPITDCDHTLGSVCGDPGPAPADCITHRREPSGDCRSPPVHRQARARGRRCRATIAQRTPIEPQARDPEDANRAPERARSTEVGPWKNSA